MVVLDGVAAEVVDRMALTFAKIQRLEESVDTLQVDDVLKINLVT